MTETWEFSLLVVGPDLQNDSVMNALAECGCDDATVGSSGGVQHLDFDRKADSYLAAVVDAIHGVEEAVAGAQVVRVLPDEYVSLADIAQRTGRAREGVRLLSIGERGPGGFPPPTVRHDERHKLWRWSDVARWFAEAHGELGMPTTGDQQRAVNACLDLMAAVPALDVGALQVIRAQLAELEKVYELHESLATFPESEARWWRNGADAA